MKVVLCASEVVPFAKTGGLADVAGALPLALEGLGHEVIVVIPGYKSALESGYKIYPCMNGVSYSVIGKKVKVFFIENKDFFFRDGLYGEKGMDYKDNLSRFSYYCRETLKLLKAIDFKVDIIHAHDWQAALIPVYLKSFYKGDRFYKQTRVIFTIHNMGYQGIFPKEEFARTGLGTDFFTPQTLEFYDKVNILKGGLIFCDIINTVSNTYMKEIQRDEFGFGLEGILLERKKSFFGVLNGIDYGIWDPQKDRIIAKNFSSNSMQDKLYNKKDLQVACSLPVKSDIPLLGMVSRIADNKGFDILAEALEQVCKMGLQLVILGVGDSKYYAALEEIAKKYPQVISLNLKFDDILAHKIYAGIDVLLMPSSYEPCGLSQLISLKYGAIPLVFKTGGLADTITPENGFLFSDYSKDGLIGVISKALRLFEDKEKWSVLMRNAMQSNFSWESAAKRYIQLYEKAIAKE